MTGWRECKLGDFAEIQTGPFGSQLHAADYVDVGIPSIMPTNIGNRLEVRTDTIACIREADAKRLEKYLIKENDIVYSRRGDVEKCAFITNKQSGWLCGTGCLRVRFISTELFPKFCAYYLSTDDIKGWVSGNAVGTTMPNLNSSILKRVPLTLPPLLEQKSIVAVLSSLDDKIDLLHRQNQTLEAMAETLFRQWFIVEAADFKEELLGGFIRLQRGISYSGKTLGGSGEGLPMHSLNSINVKGDYKYDGIKSFVGDAKPLQILKPGDLLIINTDMTPDNRIIGWPIFVPDKFEKSVCTHHLYCLELTTNRITKLYLYFLLRSKEFRNELANAANGTTVSMLSKEAIENLRIKIPPIDRIKEFEVDAKSIMDKRLSNQLQIEVLEKLRDTMLPKLMSGEVRVAL